MEYLDVVRLNDNWCTLTVHQSHCSPRENAYLIAGSSDFEGFALCAYAVALVDVVDAFAQPDADVALATQAAVQQRADFFGRLAGHTGDTDLPAGLVFYNFTIAQCEAFAFADVADGADVDATIGGILHIKFSFRLLFYYFNSCKYKRNNNICFSTYI